MKVKDLGIDEFKALIQEVVEEKLEELLGDPDRGLELKPEIKKQLERSLAAKAKGIPVEKVARDLGLEW
ncbi:MAG: hypothetical protein A2Y59_06605 [Chloroflexi bacterium RBG_13_52_14]|nr:MAG: hypothetical protein A2Y59_06605 [Chloroflexi bacterium RBG_13_52_14]